MLTNRWSHTGLYTVLIVVLLSFCVLGATEGLRETITDEAPLPWFTFSPANPKPGELITFDASHSVGEGGILSYQWDTSNDGHLDRAGRQIRTSFSKIGE